MELKTIGAIVVRFPGSLCLPSALCSRYSVKLKKRSVCLLVRLCLDCKRDRCRSHLLSRALASKENGRFSHFKDKIKRDVEFHHLNL